MWRQVLRPLSTKSGPYAEADVGFSATTASLEQGRIELLRGFSRAFRMALEVQPYLDRMRARNAVDPTCSMENSFVSRQCQPEVRAALVRSVAKLFEFFRRWEAGHVARDRAMSGEGRQEPSRRESCRCVGDARVRKGLGDAREKLVARTGRHVAADEVMALEVVVLGPGTQE
jgi:hypothetical protein